MIDHSFLVKQFLNVNLRCGLPRELFQTILPCFAHFLDQLCVKVKWWSLSNIIFNTCTFNFLYEFGVCIEHAAKVNWDGEELCLVKEISKVTEMPQTCLDNMVSDEAACHDVDSLNTSDLTGFLQNFIFFIFQSVVLVKIRMFWVE